MACSPAAKCARSQYDVYRVVLDHCQQHHHAPPSLGALARTIVYMQHYNTLQYPNTMQHTTTSMTIINNISINTDTKLP